MAKIDLRDVTVILRDGTPVTPNELELVIGDGNITWTEQRPLEYSNDRGVIDERRLADDVPLEVNLTVKLDYYSGLTAGSVPSPMDVFYFEGHASTWLSTDSDPCRPKCVDLILDNIPTCDGTDARETYVFPLFFAENVDFDVQSAQLSVRGTCLATRVIATRSDLPIPTTTAAP